jgi:hypothetical protein
VQTASYVQTETKQSQQHAGYDWSRLKKNEASLTGSVVDTELTLIEMFVCALSCGLGTIYGLILFVRGHSKGVVVIVLSMILPLVLSMLMLVYFAMMKTIFGGSSGGTKKTSQVQFWDLNSNRIPAARCDRMTESA